MDTTKNKDKNAARLEAELEAAWDQFYTLEDAVNLATREHGADSPEVAALRKKWGAVHRRLLSIDAKLHPARKH